MLLRLILLTVPLMLGTSVLQAQGVYRVVGPDGRVTFSDRPPDGGQQEVSNSAYGGRGAGNPPLPLELRSVVSRFPVTLYTAAGCSPCGAARGLLNQRGVPFTERTISTVEDQAALQKLGGDTTLPLGTIGKQQIKGFSSAEWAQYLDAAGYPAQSQLPRGYRNPEPAPLVKPQPKAEGGTASGVAGTDTSARAQRAARAAAAASEAATRPPAPPPPDLKSNPAGIRF